MVKENKLPPMQTIKMRQDTYDIISESGSIDEVVSTLTDLLKEVKTNNSISAEERKKQVKWQSENLKRAKGLEAVLSDKTFTSKGGSYRFFNEQTGKLREALSKSDPRLKGIIPDELHKGLVKASKITEAMNRASKGYNREERTSPDFKEFRKHYDFSKEHLKILSPASAENIDETFERIQKNITSTSRLIQLNRNIGYRWGEEVGYKPPRPPAELTQKIFEKMYMGGGCSGGGTPIIPRDEDDGDKVSIPGGGEDGTDTPDGGTVPSPPDINPDDIINKIAITAKDVANALAKEIRRDLIRDALEKTDYMVEKRERERKEKESEKAKKEEEKRVKRQRANEHKNLMERRKVMYQGGDQFLRAEEERRKIQEKHAALQRESLATSVLIVGKSIIDTIGKIFSRSASEVSNTLTTMFDDPLRALMDETERVGNAILGSVKKGGMGMAGVGANMRAGGKVLGSSGMAKGGAILGIAGAVASIVASILLTALNAYIGIVKAIYGKLLESSPILQGFQKMFKTAINLFFMPVGNIMGTFFMMFGMRMINFSVWFNREFPRYQYKIISFMTSGLGVIVKLFADLSGGLSFIIRALGLFVGLFPASAGVKFAIDGMADLIDASRIPMYDVANKLFDVSKSSSELHNAIVNNSKEIEKYKTAFENSMASLSTSVDTLAEVLKKETEEIMEEAPKPEQRHTPHPVLTMGKLIYSLIRPTPIKPDRLTPMGPPPLQTFAHGGYIPARPGGTVIRVGEGTRGEYIIPEGREGSGRQIVINVEIKGNIYGNDALERIIERSVNDALSRSNLI